MYKIFEVLSSLKLLIRSDKKKIEEKEAEKSHLFSKIIEKYKLLAE